jgi:hypothetical protein
MNRWSGLPVSPHLPASPQTDCHVTLQCLDQAWLPHQHHILSQAELSVAIATKAPDAAALADAQGVEVASRKGHHALWHWHFCWQANLVHLTVMPQLPSVVQPPRIHGALLIQRHCVGAAARHRLQGRVAEGSHQPGKLLGCVIRQGVTQPTAIPIAKGAQHSPQPSRHSRVKGCGPAVECTSSACNRKNAGW